MGKKYKKVSMSVNYIEHFLIFAFTVVGYIPISAFTSLVGIARGMAISAIG